MPFPTFFPSGDSALLVTFGDRIELSANRRAHALAARLAEVPLAGVGEAVPGYMLLHARLIWFWRAPGFAGEIGLHVRNLGNVKYVAFSEPDPGGNSYQPGPGREYFASVSVSI